MHDYEYELLQIKAAVTPQKETWPADDTQVSIMGDKPEITGSALHWAALHNAVAIARDHVTQAFAKMAAIEGDKTLSSTGKTDQKQAIAKTALAKLEKSKALAAARRAVDAQVADWDDYIGLTAGTPDTVGDAMVQVEIRSHLASMKPPERVAFIDAHAAEVALAVINAPPFLSGLTTAELAVVRQRIETRIAPDIAEAKVAAAKALQQTEAGWRSAVRQISERGGLEKVPLDGVAQRARTSISDV